MKSFKDIRLSESVDLNEVMAKRNDKGEVEMTKAKFAKVHKDFKETDKTGSYVLQHDGKKGTKLFPVKFVKEFTDLDLDESKDKDNDYRRVSKAITQTPKHKRDKKATDATPAKTDAKAVARRKAIEKHQARSKAKKDDYSYESVEEDTSGMTAAQKKKFDTLYKKMDGGKEHMAIKQKVHNPIKADDAFHALVKKMAMESLDEAFGNWTVTVTKPVNKLKKGSAQKVKARSAYEAINKAVKLWGDPALKSAPTNSFSVTKESVESLDEAYQQFLDKSPSNWGEEKAVAYGTKKGYKVIGVCGHGKIDGIVLFGMDAGDKAYVGKEAKVKTGQTVFRYATSRTVAGDIFPLVKIDVKKGLLYHLSQKSSEGEIEHAEFETKSSKLRYLRLLSTANLRDITGFDPGFGSMKESVELEEGKMKEFHAMVKKGMTAAQIAKKIGMKEKDVAEFMKGMNEAKELTYTVVHAKKGKVVVTAPTSYDAAQKAAKGWKLKSTAGVDAYLMKESTAPKTLSDIRESRA